MKFFQKKIIQFLTCLRLTTLTWKTDFVKIKHVYNVVKFLIIFVFTIWYLFYNCFDNFCRVNKQLTNMQQKCLRMINNNFKIISQFIIKTKINIMFIYIHFAHLPTKTRKRLRKHSHNKRIFIFCEKIKKKFIVIHDKLHCQLKITLTKCKSSWYVEQMIKIFFLK